MKDIIELEKRIAFLEGMLEAKKEMIEILKVLVEKQNVSMDFGSGGTISSTWGSTGPATYYWQLSQDKPTAEDILIKK